MAFTNSVQADQAARANRDVLIAARFEDLTIHETCSPLADQVVLGSPEPSLCLVLIVGAAAQLQIIRGGRATIGVGNTVVILEKATLGAASHCADKCALTLVALPDRPLHGGWDMATGAGSG